METASVTTIDTIDPKTDAAIRALVGFHEKLSDNKEPYHEAFFVDATSFANAYYSHKSDAIREEKMRRLHHAQYTAPELRGDVMVMRVYFVFENEETDSVVLALDTVSGDFYTATEIMNPLYPSESSNRTKLDLYRKLGIADLNCVNFDLYSALKNAEELAELERLEEMLTE